MYLIMTDDDLKVEITNYKPEPGRMMIRVNEGDWFIAPYSMRFNTVRIENNKIFMWRGLVEYEYNWSNNTFTPRRMIDRILSLFHSRI